MATRHYTLSTPKHSLLATMDGETPKCHKCTEYLEYGDEVTTLSGNGSRRKTYHAACFEQTLH